MININLTKTKLANKSFTVFKSDYSIISFLVVYFLIGIFSYKDYGVGIEEHFQRSSGFFWLDYILQYTNFESLKLIVENKILEIQSFDPELPSLKIANYYGILFDLPTAFIESFFNVQNSNNYFYFRHFINFTIFFISGIFFYKILINRSYNKLISFLGCSLYLLAPRAFGNSFFDGKDVFFLSILTITFYFYQKFEMKKNYTSLILFALFCAFSTSTRIFGLILPISFFLICFFETLNQNKILEKIKILFCFLISYLIFLFLHWPYMWIFDYSNILSFLDPFKVWGIQKVYFNGFFYQSNFLPLSYLIKWIFISTPAYYLVLFSLGISYNLKRLFLRILNLRQLSLNNDIWKGNNEKIDVFIFLCLLQIIVVYLSTEINLIKGWTHFLFLNFFLSYYAINSAHIFYLSFRFKKRLLTVILAFYSLFFIEHIYKLYIYHPYQSVYFNNFIKDNNNHLYENDFQSLSRADALKEIIKDNINKDKKKVIVGTASWTPLKNGVSMLTKNEQDKLFFSGTSDKENADYIYTNYFYETDPKYAKKYFIPNNFYIYKTLKIDGKVIYSIYKNKIK